MKTKNIFFSSLFLIAAYSCSLENETYDQLGSDNVMTTENDVKAAVTGIYHELRGGGWDLLRFYGSLSKFSHRTNTNYVAEAGIAIIVHGVLY